MKKALLLLLVVSIGILSMSCDDLLNPKAQIRCYIDPYWSSMYISVGTYNGEFNAVSAWVSANGGEFSSYTDVSEGTYHVIYDFDSEHTNAYVYTDITHTFEKRKKYTITIDENEYHTVSED
jgi:hypothetical protein